LVNRVVTLRVSPYLTVAAAKERTEAALLIVIFRLLEEAAA
jgi:hypothetical protein